ncbi:mitochondrial 54S ribosomal protein mL57 Ecym_8357 [Eremothecium cymbalariae DBVPG|uniref:RNase III domain-containing protein n=1 Tax=Eremothecium cymbalariae (strain CBS 270.75 / DBVPG 7215 / KCTC 17166 / NRRL Y-17582) TaxID=931890 RepID=G8JXQ6_ERECY|nr:Hypothetical protein Ecym_8357 [Eremothecium cymbalariae DBVPG\
MFHVKIPAVSRQSIRCVTYLHKGSRVRGLKRDPEESLKNPSGLHYEEVDPSKHQALVRKVFKLEEHGLELPDDVILQCLTHKSFAQGSKPYNEKLALLGAHFLKLQASVHYLREPQLLSRVNPKNIQENINGLNFTNLGTQAGKLVISKFVTSEFVRLKQIDNLIFWNKRDSLQSEKFNGEHTVRTTVLNALIGGTLMFNGDEKAARFLEVELFDPTKESSLVSISKPMLPE